MKPIRITLALILALCAFSAPPARAQIGTTCTITGTVYQVDGITPAAGATLTVTRADKSGKLYANTSRVYSTNSNGIVSFKVPRTVGTDTAVIHVKASFGNLASGQILYVPSDSTATLESLVRYTANPTFVVVAVPTGGGSGDTSLNGHPRLTRIENVEGQFTAGTSDSLQQVAANVFVARNVAEGKADADSMKLAFDRLGDRADADSLAGVKTTADGAFQRADTNALHAQKFKVIDNRFGDRADADSLASVKGTADAALPKADTSALHAQKFADITTSLASKLQWSDTTGFFARYGGVTTESDPTATAKAQTVARDTVDAALSQGQRSIGTAGRYTVGLDSLTLTALNDTIDASLGNKWIVSLTRNDTLYFKNWPAFPVTADLEITVVQTGTYTLVFSGVRWSGSAPTITATANKIDSFAIVNRKGYVLGFPGVQGM